MGTDPARGTLGSVLEWILIGLGYAVGLLFFQLLGGIGAAGRAIERWGRESSVRRIERSGLTPEDYGRTHAGTRRVGSK